MVLSTPMRFLIVLFAATTGLLSHGATVSLPLQDGERLTYRVSWAIVPGAGEIRIEAQAEPATGPPRLKITTSTTTRNLARLLLPFDAKAESLFDRQTGKLVALTESSVAREKRESHTVAFDHAARTARYEDTARGEPARTLPFPDGDPVDLIMALLETRFWNLQPGEKRDVLVLFNDDFYELTIHFARYEKLETRFGSFDTIVLEPRMDKTAPKGMFKRGSTVRVWISQDEHRLPVRFEVEFKIGTGTATLVSYLPPPVLKPSTAEAPAKTENSLAADAQNPRP